MTKHVYQPYRASALANSLRGLSAAATPAPWERLRTRVPIRRADEELDDEDRADEAQQNCAKVTAPCMTYGHKRDKTRAGVVCSATDMAGRFAEQADNDLLLIAFMRNHADEIATLLDRIHAMEAALDFYARRDNYDYVHPAVNAVPVDRGTKARAALFNITEEAAAVRPWPPMQEEG